MKKCKESRQAQKWDDQSSRPTQLTLMCLQAAEQFEAFVSLVGGLVFEVALQLTAQAIVVAL